MDQLLLPYLHAPDDAERRLRIDELLLIHAAPVVRHTIRRRLGFYVDQRGRNPHNQDAEDLYQDIIAKVVQALADSSTTSAIENLNQYVSRIAANACNDILRSKSPARARLKNNLRYVLSQHEDFALWKNEAATLCGFRAWIDTSKSGSSEGMLIDKQKLENFRFSRFKTENIKQIPLTKLVAELFRWIGSPVQLDELVKVTATLLDVEDRPLESLDDVMNEHLEARIVDNKFTTASRLEAEALLRTLWQELKELSPEQRDVFCFSFEDEAGRDLFTMLLEAEIVDLKLIGEELGRPMDTIVLLWSKMPMDDEAIAKELRVTRVRVQKWRFRALEKLRKGLLPFSGRK
jgi:RNA polymerase sigma factor (sigma-70 family)